MFSIINAAEVTESLREVTVPSLVMPYGLLWMEGPTATNPDRSSPVLPPSAKVLVLMARVSEKHGVGH